MGLSGLRYSGYREFLKINLLKHSGYREFWHSLEGRILANTVTMLIEM